ncbi:MAG: rhodanese-related sulfurtransferase [Chitinophagaceae bacterium]|nr:rhodanese-related sulfurtransferase [Chitinophagaceae bacterium]
MHLLHNRVSNAELKQRLMQETFSRITISFYKYVPIVNPQEFRDELYKQFNSLNVFGRIYIAHEGINAQVSIPENAFESFRDFLYAIPGWNGLRLNRAVDDDGKSFWVLAIKVRDKIVADGINDPSFSMENKGKYVDAANMNRLLDDPDTIVVDMRNHYEYEVGHFERAIEIPSDTFREQLPMACEMLKGNEEKNIIMYCTGGIRCEKASAFLLHNGFTNVFHLEGGIIKYAQDAKSQGLELKFHGKNFVFDNRLGERITDEVISTCHQCGNVCDRHVNCENAGCHLLFIQCDACYQKMAGCCSDACKETIHLPLERQQQLRSGVDRGRNIFNKSRERLRPRINRSS